MSDEEFKKLSSFVTTNYGIKLPPIKKIMVEGRLQKRLKATQISSFEKYIAHVFSEEGSAEMVHMIDAISTNKTDFFRESSHFELLTEVLIPKYLEINRSKNITIWSAAASTGEEIYTLAMVLEEFNASRDYSDRVDYRIFGTDISVEAIKAANAAVYSFDRIKDIPVALRNKYFLRSKDRKANQVRVIPTLRNKVSFSRLNLMDINYAIDTSFDILFCRNVLIYFDKEIQEKVINKLCQKLKTGGYFFLGHSESIIGKKVPLKQIKPTVYERI